MAETARKLRVGVLGLTHDHIWNMLPDLARSPLGELAAAADPNAELREKFSAGYGCPQVFASYEALLDEVALDAVLIYADNATSASLAVQAAQRGLHALVEKPMAANLAGAERMLAQAGQAGVLLMVNWPFAWRRGLRQALALAQAGKIGEVFSLKYRAAHAGPKEYGCSPYFYNWLHDPELNGAGALMDYCSYGAVLARYLLGMPQQVVGVAGRLQKDYIHTDDNAVIVMQWERAIAIAEASWTQVGNLTSYQTVVYGSQGTLFVGAGAEGKVYLADDQNPDGLELSVPDLPVEQRNGTSYFLQQASQRLPVVGLCSAQVGRDAQEILEAGLLSARRGATVTLPLG